MNGKFSQLLIGLLILLHNALSRTGKSAAANKHKWHFHMGNTVTFFPPSPCPQVGSESEKRHSLEYWQHLNSLVDHHHTTENRKSNHKSRSNLVKSKQNTFKPQKQPGKRNFKRVCYGMKIRNADTHSHGSYIIPGFWYDSPIPKHGWYLCKILTMDMAGVRQCCNLHCISTCKKKVGIAKN